MQPSGRIALDPRLSMIARLVGHCDCCADIGCDHGRLGAFLLQSGQCERVLFADVSEPSLGKARTLVDNLGLSERAIFRAGDGLDVIDEPVQAVIVAGMGGTTIADILRRGRERLKGATLVLQPNVALVQLREALPECGYAIDDERVVRDGRRHYVVIRAVPGRAQYTRREAIVGPVLLERMPPELEGYAAFRLRVAQKALRGAVRGADDLQARALEEEIEIWEEVCACLRRRDRC